MLGKLRHATQEEVAAIVATGEWLFPGCQVLAFDRDGRTETAILRPVMELTLHPGQDESTDGLRNRVQMLHDLETALRLGGTQKYFVTAETPETVYGRVLQKFGFQAVPGQRYQKDI